MMNFFTNYRQEQRMQQLKQRLPEEYVFKLAEFSRMLLKNNASLRIYKGQTPWINARSSQTRKTIEVNHQWISALSNTDTALADALFLTMGHEYTHLSPELRHTTAYFRSVDKFFVKQFNEVYADFNGILLTLNGDREQALSAMNRKAIFLDPENIHSSTKKTHPSWEKRMYYVSEYNFNAALIYQLAADTGCKNRKLIQKAICFHPELKLK